MFEYVVERLGEEGQGQRALARWDNEGGAGPGTMPLEPGPSGYPIAETVSADAGLTRRRKPGHPPRS